jgi:RimJ/RimL family protein N-acetyltransferase
MTNQITPSTLSCVFLRGFTTDLRPLELADASTIYRGMNDPDNWQYLSSRGAFPKGIGFEEDWIREKQKPNNHDVTLGICLTATNDLIGTMGLHQIDYLSRTAVTGTVIYKSEHKNQGYGTDAKMALLRYAFEVLNLRLIESRAIAFNGRSARYSEKCGYQVDGRLRARHERKGGIHDELILSVTYPDWLPKWEAYQKAHVAKAE